MKLTLTKVYIRESFRKIAFPAILAIFVFGLSYYYTANKIQKYDWNDCLRPGAQALISGKNPHTRDNCNWMTWTLVPLIPIAFLPANIGRALLSSAALVSYYLVARKLGASPLVAGIMLANPQYLIQSITDPNVDWLVAIGFILPPQIGLFFCMIKPQISIGLVIYWLVQSYKKDGIRCVFTTFLPVTLLFGITILLYGPYFLSFGKLIGNTNWNMSFWPYSIIAGIPLIILAFVKKNSGYAILSGPFFSPYVGFYSWPIAFLGLLPRHKKIAIIISGLVFLSIVIYGIYRSLH